MQQARNIGLEALRCGFVRRGLGVGGQIQASSMVKKGDPNWANGDIVASLKGFKIVPARGSGSNCCVPLGRERRSRGMLA
jgi:hypothetical protein